MADMFKVYDKSKLPINHCLRELHDKEKNKKRKKKLAGLFLTEEEKEMLPEIVKTLKIVHSGSTYICGNDVTLSKADLVSSIICNRQLIVGKV